MNRRVTGAPTAVGLHRRFGTATTIMMVVALMPSPASAQTNATLTRWDVFAATGGSNSQSINATRNPRVVSINPNDGAVWFVAQRPTLRVGTLDPISNLYTEWAPVTGGATSGAPAALAFSASTGDVWVTTGGVPEVMVSLGGGNTFRTYTLPYAGAVVKGVAPTADGSAAYIAMRAGSNTSILRVQRGPQPLGGTTSVTAARWRFSSSSDDPAHLTMDSGGFLWFTNKYRNTVVRFDPSLANSNLTQWTLPAGTGAAGLQIVNGPSGALTVCVVAEGGVTSISGQATCLDVASSTFRTLPRPTGYDFPQHVAVTSAGELLVTEQNGNAVSFITSAAVSAGTLQPVSPLTGSATTRLAVVAAVSAGVAEAAVSPMTLTVAPSTTSVAGAEDSGHVKFVLPSLPALSDQPGVAREARPAGLSAAFGSSGPGTGSVYLAEYFDGPAPIETRMAGVISRLTVGGAAPDEFLIQPASLIFSADVGGAGPTAQLSVEEKNGRTISFTATKSQPWLTLSPSSGSTNESVSVTVDHTALAASATPYTDTITIDDGAGGAPSISIPVSLTVVERPTMVVTPLFLQFQAVNTDTTLPGAKTFAISSSGGGTLEWTATVNIPGVEAQLEVAGQPLNATVSGSGPATVTLHIGSVPGTPGLREGTVTISSPNATNTTATVDIDYEVTNVTQTLIVDKTTLTFDVVNGGAAAPAQIVNLTNAGGQSNTWGTVFPYTETPPMPAWLHVTPEVAATAAGATVPITVTVDHAALGPGTYAAVITIDDHTGNSPPAIVGVTVIVRAAEIAFSADGLTFSPGGPATQSVTLNNPGDAPLTVTPVVTINNGTGWLTVTPEGEITVPPGGDVPFTVTTDPAGLAGGTYTAQITVANPYSTNGSDTVFISLTVAADTTAPVFTVVPPNQTLEATGPGGAAATFAAQATDDTGTTTITYAPASGSTFPLGPTTVTATATDAAGNTANATFTVTVVDTTAPALTVPANQGASGSGPTVVSYPAATATDAVTANPVISCSPASGSTFPAGPTTVSCTATDGAGNASSGSFTVTVAVVDTTPPAVTVPAPISTEATQATGAVVTFSASASDTVSGTLTPSCSPASGSTFPVGPSSVTCSATDGAGNTGSATFTVTVTDTTSPAIGGASNLVQEATSASGAAVSYSLTATDIVDGARPVSCSPASGSTFALGTSNVTCTASDTRGNSSAASFSVLVRDTIAPALTVPAHQSASGSGPTVVSYPAATATDAVTASPVVSCSPASGSTFSAGPTTVSCTATDAAGNTSSGSFTVTVAVVDTTPPAFGAAPNVTAQATGAGGAVVDYTKPTAIDVIDGVRPVTCTPAPGSTFAIGATPVSCSASDVAGNTSTTTLTVTVVDTTAPVLSGVSPNLTIEATSPSGAPATYATPTASDLVDGTRPVSCSPASGTTFAIATQTVTCTSSDTRGNTASASFTVTVRDTTAPVITPPANQSVVSAVAIAVGYPPATAIESVSNPVTIAYSQNSGTVFPLGTTTVTVTATDARGNSSTRTFTVTVAPPAYTVAPASLYFKTGRLAYCNGIAVGPNWKDQGFVVTNPGAGSLTFSTTTATSWLRVLPASGTVGAGASTTLTVSVDLSGLGRGIYQGSFTFSGNGLQTVVPVTLEIGNALPTLCLTPKSMTWGSAKTNTTLVSRVYDVLNVGDDPMANWTSTKTITNGTLTLSASSGTSPKTVTVTVKTGKKRGAQSGKVDITVPGAVNGTQAVDLTWTVQ